ncbi:MAG: TldD/PmbA family protein [Candidatus Bathyarchaeota archaeon]|nr:TldD/PmbA family protein [Candidatus Bathyarchaeota archaeon]
MEDLQFLIDHGLSRGADFVEVRYQKRSRTMANVKKGELDSATSGVLEGYGIRALKNGSWGFAVTSLLDRATLLHKVEEAVRLAVSSAPAKTTKSELATAKATKIKAVSEVKDDPKDHSLEEKIKLALELDKFITGYSNEIASTSVRYDENLVEKRYINSEGSDCYLFDVKPELFMMVIAKKGDVMTEVFEGVCRTGGWEIFKTKDPQAMAKRACERAVRLLSAKVVPSGTHVAILDPELVGLLSHEAIGHTVEADLVISGTAATGKIGEKVASDMVTLVDDGTIPWCAGWVPFDDEGVEGKKTVVIEKGVLKSYLHSRETAAKFNVEPTGNSRAWNYRDIPLIRMRATYIEAGDWDREEIIQDTKDGLVLFGSGSGQADSNAEFMFGVQEACKIHNGEIGESFRGVTISGSAYAVLKSVDALGKDFSLELGRGYCGKMQIAKVDAGGPTVRCKMLFGGV